MLIFKTKHSINDIEPYWDNLANSVYQKKDFLYHAQKYNPCHQRYYLGYDNDMLVVGAVVYKLNINILTFAKYHLKTPMMVIGIPVSVDAKGIIGDSIYYKDLVSYILQKERGLILCLNYDFPLNLNGIIEMQTLPTLLHKSYDTVWEDYLQTLRHGYRRRILNAEKKFQTVTVQKSGCSQFTDEHYKLYLNIMERTKTKLETLVKDFFSNLPSHYILHSSYSKTELIAWHITVFEKGTYYFLFGGLNYNLRNKYDAYYNNLIQIIKEGAALNSEAINLGQTAEISKNRLGAKTIDKKMFLFHKYTYIRTFFRMTRHVLGYKQKATMVNIHKNENVFEGVTY